MNGKKLVAESDNEGGEAREVVMSVGLRETYVQAAARTPPTTLEAPLCGSSP
jgi:hypothetical protein